MMIKEARLYIQQGEPATRSARTDGFTEKVPPGLSGLFTRNTHFRRLQPEEIIEFKDDTLRPTYTCTLRLVTGDDLDAHGLMASGFQRDELEWEARDFKARIAPMLIGVDTFDREFIWQRLWYAQRFLYTGRQLLDTVDGMLWDLAVRQARMPLYQLLGGCRERVPAYQCIDGDSIDELAAAAVNAKEAGFKGAKDHSYRGVRANIELARQMRAAVGDDFLLLHDPVENYTCEEALQVGRELERQNYTWMEEPLQDHDMMGLKKLCDSLDLPILAMEWVGYVGGQPFSAAPYLALGAADIIRQRAIGITGQLKLAQLCESFGVEVHGGNPHVTLAIGNDPLYETGRAIPLAADAELDCRGTLVVDEGYMTIASNSNPVSEPDWDEMERTALAVI